MNNDIDLKKTEKMGYISYWCQKVIPLVFDDSLSYYEAICKFMQKLNEVISALNNNALCIDELQDKYIILQKNFDTLEEEWKAFQTTINERQTEFENNINSEFNSFKTYVENYLDNIDIASFVNTKIDEMVASGEFNTLIINALSSLIAGDGIKIENGSISSTNYYLKNTSFSTKDTTNNDGVYCNGSNIILGYGNSNLGNYKYGSVKVLGSNNKWGNGSNDSCILGNENNISGDNNKAVVIVGRNNNTNKEDVMLGEYLQNISISGNKSVIMGFYNTSDFTGKNIVIGNGTSSNRHNAIVIPEGTSAPISINQEVNCGDNFITRTFVEGDNVDTIYAEKPNALVNASEVKASIDSLQNSFDELNHNIIYGEGQVNFENNITGNGKIAFNNIPSSPVLLYLRFTHPGKTAGGADSEFKVGTIDFSSINIDKDYIPRYINAFVNSYPCIISLRTTDNVNIYDIYYNGNAIPESIGATNFIVKFNQIIGFTN